MGICLERYRSKVILCISVFVLLCFLAYFKYFNFFLSSFASLFGYNSVSLNIILPIGISFYIFSALSYLIDVYRKAYRAEKNFLFFALYISFFPKLTAGPIVRGNDFLTQIKSYRGFSFDAFKTGIQIFVFGLFKKMVLADHLGVFVDDVFHAPNAFNKFTVILAVLSYSFQIYFDFSGYSDMAIGLSQILGFDFSSNFNMPYISQSFSEFWKRWHISLSSWFQDYLYIPLGGSRKGIYRTYFNLLIVMIISGLWHGAGWTFVLWGVFHGLASCFNKFFSNKIKDNNSSLFNIFKVAITYIFVSLFWVVFRADSLSTALNVYKSIFSIHTGINQPYFWSFIAIICYIIAVIFAVLNSKKAKQSNKYNNLIINGYYPILDLSRFWYQVLFFVFCGLTIILGYYGNTAFIYGAF